MLLLGTTAIHGGFDTLRIFRSGTDAARIKQKQVCSCKLVFSEVHGRTSLNERRRRCAAYFQKKGFENFLLI